MLVYPQIILGKIQSNKSNKTAFSSEGKYRPGKRYRRNLLFAVHFLFCLNVLPYSYITHLKYKTLCKISVDTSKKISIESPLITVVQLQIFQLYGGTQNKFHERDNTLL